MEEKYDGLERYRGYCIGGASRPLYRDGCTAIGEVLVDRRFGSIVMIKQIEGPTFESKHEAEKHGLELARKWVDEHLSEQRRVDVEALVFGWRLFAVASVYWQGEGSVQFHRFTDLVKTFLTEEEAEAFGFAVARAWVDEL